jgi:hypothetical protein
MKYIYEISSDLVLSVWDTENPNEENKPFLLQPRHPEGRDWADAQEVQSWIEALIEEWSKPAPVEESTEE